MRYTLQRWRHSKCMSHNSRGAIIASISHKIKSLKAINGVAGRPAPTKWFRCALVPHILPPIFCTDSVSRLLRQRFAPKREVKPSNATNSPALVSFSCCFLRPIYPGRKIMSLGCCLLISTCNARSPASAPLSVKFVQISKGYAGVILSEILTGLPAFFSGWSQKSCIAATSKGASRTIDRNSRTIIISALFVTSYVFEVLSAAIFVSFIG